MGEERRSIGQAIDVRKTRLQRREEFIHGLHPRLCPFMPVCQLKTPVVTDYTDTTPELGSSFDFKMIRAPWRISRWSFGWPLPIDSAARQLPFAPGHFCDYSPPLSF